MTFAANPTAAGEIRYRLTDLGDLSGGADQSYVYGLNDVGQVVGMSDTENGLRAFLWYDGFMQDLGTLGGNYYSRAASINSHGQVVGESKQTAGGEMQAFVWDGGSMHDIGTLGGANATAAGINAAGDIVGSAYTEANELHAFLWRDGSMEDLGTLGGATSIGLSLNNAGQVVGASIPSVGSPLTGFLWSDGSLAALREPPTLGGEQIAESINDRGQIVGYTSGDDGHRAFVWENGAARDLQKLDGPHSFAYFIASDGRIVGSANPTDDSSFGHAVLWESSGAIIDLNTRLDDSGEGWTLLDARRVNAAGQIVGNGETGNGVTHGYLLTPYMFFPPVPGDTDADGDVDIADLNNVRNHFGEGVTLGPPTAGEAYPFDGRVDIVDLALVRNAFGTTAPVPEPSAIVIGALSVFACLLLTQARTGKLLADF